METRHYLTCLWPGLPELWWRGRLSALPPAIAFGMGLNLLLVMRFIYPHWLSGTLVTIACWVAVASWVFYVIRSVRELPLIIAPRTVSEEPDRFQEAQFEFLQGNWREAEKLVLGVLAIEPRDPPALLMLSSVYRHTERLAEASALIDEMGRLESADSWFVELDAERRRVRRDFRAIQSADNSAENSTDHGNSAADLTAA